MKIQNLSDAELISRSELAVARERQLLIEVLNLLREIERRKLYCSLGYSSLFDYAVKHLKYSEDQAFRRIRSMRMLRDLPELTKQVESGAIGLTHMTMAQTLFRNEKIVDRGARIQVFKKLANKSTREAEKVVLSLSSVATVGAKDSIRAVNESEIEIRFSADESLALKISQLKGLLAHKYPNISLAELFSKLCDLGLNEWSPARPPHRQIRKLPAAPKVKRHIPAATRRPVWARDRGRCRNCGSWYSLEVDHVRPFVLGGSSTDPGNLRLLCRACNLRKAICDFGLVRVGRGWIRSGLELSSLIC